MIIGDAVLHPKYGVGVIRSIDKLMIDGVARDCFVIPKPSISSTIFVPVDAAEKLGLRLLSTASKLKQAVSILSGKADDTNLCTEDSKINWGDPVDLAHAIRIGGTKTKSGHIKASRQQQLKHARVLLAEELSAVLGMSEESMIALVDREVE